MDRPGGVKFAVMTFAGTALLTAVGLLLALQRIGGADHDVSDLKSLAVILLGGCAAILALIAVGLWLGSRLIHVLGVIACLLVIQGSVKAALAHDPQSFLLLPAFGQAMAGLLVWVLPVLFGLTLLSLLVPSGRGFFWGARRPDASVPDLIAKLEQLEDRNGGWALVIVQDLEKTTGQRFGNDPQAWRVWWNRTSGATRAS